MNFYVNGVSSTPVAISTAIDTAVMMSRIFGNNNTAVSSCYGQLQEYAEIYAEGEKEIQNQYKKELARKSVILNVSASDMPDINEIREEYAAKNPEYAVARFYCEGIKNDHDKYIAKKMAQYDKQHHWRPAFKWGLFENNMYLQKDNEREEYLRQLEKHYRATHPAYDILKSEEEMQDLEDSTEILSYRTPSMREITLL